MTGLGRTLKLIHAAIDFYEMFLSLNNQTRILLYSLQLSKNTVENVRLCHQLLDVDVDVERFGSSSTKQS